MSRYEITHLGRHVAAEVDDSGFLHTSVTLLVDGRPVAKEKGMSGVRLHADLQPPVSVELKFGTLGGVKRCVLLHDQQALPLRKTRSDKEEEEDEGILDFL